jgi:ribonuclease Y
MVTNILVLIISIGISFAGIVQILKKKNFIDVKKIEEESAQLIEKSKKEASQITEDVKNQSEILKERLKDEFKKREKRIETIKGALTYKEESLEKKEQKIRELNLKVATYKEEAQSKKNTIERTVKEITEKLSQKSGESMAELKEKLIKRYEEEVKENFNRKISNIEENIKETAPRVAKAIITNTMQRLCSATSVETRAVLIKVPKDQIKGKIVGKDGKNILTLESLLDVAIVFNDLPNIISISSYNLVMRRIAEKTIEKLIANKGGINEETVKRTVKEAEQETDDELYKLGKEAVEKIGIKNDNKEFLRIVGRLKYRTSYGQNIMKHSMEVAWIASMLASEAGMDVQTCKIGGFLHDLGKAIDQDPNVKDTHDHLTKELMEKYGFSEEATHAAWTHHDAAPQKTPEALLVKAADSVSGGRPGARQDSIEKYIERMQAIDETIHSFAGVKKSFIMSAGREVRVYVDPEAVIDESMPEIAKGMAEKIEENVTYPGKIRIKVIRRTKAMEVAK